MKNIKPSLSLARGSAFLTILCAALLSGGAALAQSDGLRQAPEAGRTLVPEGRWISDFEARAALAEIYALHDKTWINAVREWKLLAAESPQPASLVALEKMADIAGFLGQAQSTRHLNQEILSHPDTTLEQRLRVANRSLSWGDFQGAEKIYREYLRVHPRSREIFLKLTRLLASAERYEEAEEMCRKRLLNTPEDAAVLIQLAEIKRLEKEYAAALKILDNAWIPEQEALTARAETLLQAKRLREAGDIYRQLANSPPSRLEALVGLARCSCEEGDPAQARPFAEQALSLSPAHVEARFYRDWQTLGNPRRLDAEIKTLTSPRQMERLGDLYARYGFFDQAVACHEAALKKDPEYFPAAAALAQTLAVRQRYDRAIALYRELNSDFPGNSKLLIGLARVLGWSRRYGEALDLYQKIVQDNPANPVPKKEQARTAVWAKQIKQALGYYDTLLAPPVDRALAADLEKIAQNIPGGPVKDLAGAVRRQADQGSLFQGYEAAKNALATDRIKNPAHRRKVEKAILSHLAAYRIQKEIFLERKAKLLAWDKRPTLALDHYDELIAFKPGNQEALFDRGQIACSLGLHGEARQSYQRLLEIDPLHSLAGPALRRGLRKNRPALRLGQDYWEEEGRDEIARMRRAKSTLGVSVPLFDNYTLELLGHGWVERPKQGSDRYEAFGHTLALHGAFNRYLSGGAGWTQKRYRGEGPAATETGYARLSWFVNDVIRLDVGYDRSEEISNLFAIRQGGIESDSFWGGFLLRPERRTALSGKAGYLRYSDHNEGEFALVSASYNLTDHPRTVRVSAQGEYRNTRHRELYLYSGSGELLDIIHPYWTPRDYVAASVTLEWNHDLSPLYFCGAEGHFYGVKATFGVDSEDNPSARIAFDWSYEFLERWMLSLKGLLHRSREWDAAGAQLEIRYRF